MLNLQVLVSSPARFPPRKLVADQIDAAVGAHVGVVRLAAVVVDGVVLVRALLGPTLAVARVDRCVVAIVQRGTRAFVITPFGALRPVFHPGLVAEEDDRRLRTSSARRTASHFANRRGTLTAAVAAAGTLQGAAAAAGLLVKLRAARTEGELAGMGQPRQAHVQLGVRAAGMRRQKLVAGSRRDTGFAGSLAGGGPLQVQQYTDQQCQQQRRGRGPPEGRAHGQGCGAASAGGVGGRGTRRATGRAQAAAATAARAGGWVRGPGAAGAAKFRLLLLEVLEFPGYWTTQYLRRAPVPFPFVSTKQTQLDQIEQYRTHRRKRKLSTYVILAVVLFFLGIKWVSINFSDKLKLVTEWKRSNVNLTASASKML
eukprot:SAG22_NODE_63_length_23302_cov_17.506551_11_plen_370_part_00